MFLIVSKNIRYYTLVSVSGPLPSLLTYLYSGNYGLGPLLWSVIGEFP